MANPKLKGVNGENEVLSILSSIVDKANIPVAVKQTLRDNLVRNTGLGRSYADILFLDFAIEVKRVERDNLNGWWLQCVKNAEEAKRYPVLFHRANRSDWNIYLYFDAPSEYGVKWRTRCQISLTQFENMLVKIIESKFAQR